MANTKSILITNCQECPYHQNLPDPDPNDSFCYDDMKVLCTKTQRFVTVACRPYRLTKESDIPSWCPLP